MDEQEEDNEGIDYLPPKLFLEICISTLDEVLEQLLILKTINHWPEVDQADAVYKTIDKRFSEHAVYTADTPSYKLSSFKSRCASILAIIKITVEELKTCGSYDKLLNIINVFKMTKSDEQKLKEDTVLKELKLEKLERIFQEDVQFYHRKIEECMTNIGIIKDKIEDFKIESEIKLNYVTNWQNSKIEMNETLLSRNELQKMDDIKKIDSNVYKETRVHQEILHAFREMQKDLESEIDAWKVRYNNDLTQLDEKINKLKVEQQKQQEKTIKLKEVFSSRQKEIDSYKDYKVQQEEIRADLEKRNKAATIIQAWWRGTMVRKGFGKFRKKKDKKPKKKSSEQKPKS